MTVLKQYNTGTSTWETVVVGQPGAPGIQTGSVAPANTSVLWMDTADTASQVAVPSGGTAGQVLAKTSGTDYATGWVDHTGNTNAIINGAFDIWQRGTSFAAERYTADRWYATNLAGTWAQETTIVPAGSKNSMKFTASASGTTYLMQVIETANALQFVGQTVTISAEFASSVSLQSVVALQYTTSVDSTIGDAWTTISPVSGGNITTTSTTFSRLSAAFAVPSTAKSLRAYVATNSMVSGNIVYYGEIQLEAGSSATPFKRNAPSIQGELAACQRYYETGTGYFGLFTERGSNYAIGEMVGTGFAVTKRGTPTITLGTTSGTYCYTNSGNTVNINTASFAQKILSQTGGTGRDTELTSTWTASAEL
jgi:hypothetical protein